MPQVAGNVWAEPPLALGDAGWSVPHAQHLLSHLESGFTASWRAGVPLDAQPHLAQESKGPGLPEGREAGHLCRAREGLGRPWWGVHHRLSAWGGSGPWQGALPTCLGREAGSSSVPSPSPSWVQIGCWKQASC